MNSFVTNKEIMLIGMNMNEASLYAKNTGLILRASKINGINQILTLDSCSSRVNLIIEDNVIKDIDFVG